MALAVVMVAVVMTAASLGHLPASRWAHLAASAWQWLLHEDLLLLIECFHVWLNSKLLLVLLGHTNGIETMTRHWLCLDGQLLLLLVVFA